MSKWIKVGDLVLVLSGNSKGEKGVVLRRVGDRVLVQGVNKRIKHVKAKSEEMAGGRISIEQPIHISNVMLCSKEGARLRTKVADVDGKKVLVCKKSADVVRNVKASKDRV